jgi:hypothetical protein
MRWRIGGYEYDVETAEALAHSGAGRYDEEPERVLYRTPEGYYFLVDRIEEGWNTGHAITTLNAQEAHQSFLELPMHVADEDDAFEFAEGNSES